MRIRHGSSLIVLGAILAILGGVLGYYFSGGQVWICLAAATVPLFLFSVYVNLAVPKQYVNVSPSVPVTPVAVRGRFASFHRSAFFYLTMGSLVAIWSVVWACYLWEHRPVRDVFWYVCGGLILTGLLLVAVGFAMTRFRGRFRTGQQEISVS